MKCCPHVELPLAPSQGCSVPSRLFTHPSALAYGAPGSCPPGPSPGPAASPSENLEAKSGPLESAGGVGRGGEGRASSGLDLVSRPLPVVHCHRLSHQLCYIRSRGWTAGERKTWTPPAEESHSGHGEPHSYSPQPIPAPHCLAQLFLTTPYLPQRRLPFLLWSSLLSPIGPRSFPSPT